MRKNKQQKHQHDAAAFQKYTVPNIESTWSTKLMCNLESIKFKTGNFDEMKIKTTKHCRHPLTWRIAIASTLRQILFRFSFASKMQTHTHTQESIHQVDVAVIVDVFFFSMNQTMLTLQFAETRFDDAFAYCRNGEHMWRTSLVKLSYFYNCNYKRLVQNRPVVTIIFIGPVHSSFSKMYTENSKNVLIS